MVVLRQRLQLNRGLDEKITIAWFDSFAWFAFGTAAYSSRDTKAQGI